MPAAQGGGTPRTSHGRRTRIATILVGALAVAVLVASCSSSDSSDESKPADTEKPANTDTDTNASATPAAFVPEGPEKAIAAYLQSQGIEYIGDCADAELPRDEGKWCSTLVEGADSNEKKVYEIGPVGEEPEQILTVDRRGHATLTPGLQVDVDDGDVGVPRQLTPEELRANAFIAANILLDQQAGIGSGFADLPPMTTPPDTGTGGGTGGDTGGGTGGGGTGGGPVVTPDPGDITYVPDGEIVVEDPNVDPGGSVIFRGGGCLPNEVLDILFDGKKVGTLVSDGEGNFAGSLEVPTGTAPGTHLLTVRGSRCELNVTINVLGGLAFTGASNDTSGTVLVGVAAIVLGLVLVIGSRRRRSSAGARVRPSSG